MRKRKWLVVLCVVCLAAAAANLLIARIIAQRIRRSPISNTRMQYIFAPHPSHPNRKGAAAAKSGNTATPSLQKRGSKIGGGDRDGVPLPR